MAIRPSVSASFSIVSCRDDALADVLPVIMDQYETTQDFSVLNDKWVEHYEDGEQVPDEERRCKWDGLASLDEQPTVFRCRPLQEKYRRLVSSDITPNEQWEIFARHVEAIYNVLDEDGNDQDLKDWWRGNGDKRRVADHVRDHDGVGRLPFIIWTEIVASIIHRGISQGGTDPFGQRGLWRVSQLAREHRRRVEMIKETKVVRSKTTVVDVPSS